MRGHIVKRYKNSYSIVLNLGKDPSTGKPKQQWVSVKGTKKDAEKRLSELLTQLDKGTFVKPGKTTLGDFLKRWITDYQHNLSPRGFERYRSIIEEHIIPDLGGMLLTRLRPEHLKKHYTDKMESGLSARTVRYHHAILHVALKTAAKWGMVNRNVADVVDPPRIKRSDIKTWDENEVRQFLEQAKNSPYYALFYTALYTGMRRSELLALRWKDVDFVFSQISVNRGLHQLRDGSYVYTEPKSTNSRRTIALSPSVFLLLREHKEKEKSERLLLGVSFTDDDLVFCTHDGKPLRPNTITRAWTMLTKRCGIQVIRLHDARHTHASLMLKQGIHPKIVQERLGHSSIQITLDTYSHVAPGLQEAAALSFDELVNSRREKSVIEKFD